MLWGQEQTASSFKSLGLQGNFFFIVSPGSTPSGNLMEIISTTTTKNCLSQVDLAFPLLWNLKSEVVSSSYPSRA